MRRDLLDNPMEAEHRSKNLYHAGSLLGDRYRYPSNGHILSRPLIIHVIGRHLLF